MVIDSHQKRFAMNMQLRHCFTRVKLFRLKKSRFFLAFFIFKKAKCVKKFRISKSGIKKAKVASLSTLQAMNGVALGSSLKYVSYLINVPKIIRGYYSR